ncbi:hypothetical protein ACIQVR_06900 [Streptomyces xanthochromogenes]|uniref:hypothetical protein n=1 Tax=Streptomyces xanthochromogenes TaxID=67384 RepID=UPI00380E5350
MNDETNDFAPSAPVGKTFKFSSVGDSVNGYVESVSQRIPLNKFGTDVQDVDNSGNPRWQRVITLATPDGGESDDGLRTVWMPVGSQMATAIGDAMKRAGAATGNPASGAFLKLTFARTRPSKFGNPAKIYVAEYTQPANTQAKQVPEAAANTWPTNGNGWAPPTQNNAPAPWQQ